ncbi:hypothetical protein BpHYR1_034504 [Brachionus plicatilis]|uniref:Uncharacterized protein n=1 Tax=Brachionus plicatilis TaxID=10195 RepID=A0A3M7RPI6_BRAPC|nr:hypothetical protein BpHYR1_034504 [Brachionus plicatilis]
MNPSVHPIYSLDVFEDVFMLHLNLNAHVCEFIFLCDLIFFEDVFLCNVGISKTTCPLRSRPKTEPYHKRRRTEPYQPN